MNTQTNSNFGLKGKKPKFFLSSSKFSAQGPNPRRDGEVLTLDATSFLFIGYPCIISHSSMQTSPQISFLLPLSLTLGHTQTHTHSQKSLNSLKKTPPSPLKNLEI